MPAQAEFYITLPIWQVALLLGPALLYAAAALLAHPGVSADAAWFRARGATSGALGLAAGSLCLSLLGASGSGYTLRADGIGGIVVLLVAFVGWVIVRYSQRCLNGERGELRYIRWLMATLACVNLVLVTNHVLVLAVSWTGTSLFLHRLLTFFGDRPAAVVAAHKKFIVARSADLCMLAAVALLFHAYGTLYIDQILVSVVTTTLPTWAAQTAIVLVACAALLKCAALPFHGWLIQVMEAPTPVSALLHAGVVNLGGFVLLRFAPLVDAVPTAQALLVAVGTATAVLAALVMTTRISIKVMLAWSTCAQMGFMLMECGLGIWEMALLHLVAHSLYKAHAFLGAGGAVRRAMIVELTVPAPPPGPLALLLGVLAGVGMTCAAGYLVGVLAPGHLISPAAWVLAGIAALALVPLLQVQAPGLGGWCLPVHAIGGFGVALAYLGLHAVLAPWVMPDVAPAASALSIGVALAFGMLFTLQSIIIVAPNGPLARLIHPWFYGGLFLDQWFSRVAFALWPPPGTGATGTPLPIPEATTEVVVQAHSTDATAGACS